MVMNGPRESPAVYEWRRMGGGRGITSVRRAVCDWSASVCVVVDDRGFVPPRLMILAPGSVVMLGLIFR